MRTTLTKKKISTVGIVLICIAVIILLTGIVVAGYFILRKPPVDPAFPIDTVTTWVDGTDDEWRKLAAEYKKTELAQYPDAGMIHSAMREPEPITPLDRDELYYSAHSVAKFMPWVRNYYLVTMRPHKPSWWPLNNKMGDINMILVHHDDIFPREEHSKLPVFNSNAIQSKIGNIPGLADHFILFDDDFFVGKPMKKSDFFSTDGRPVTKMQRLNPSVIKPGNWQKLCMNTQRVILSQTKRPYANVPEHVCVPLLKSTWQYVTNYLCKDIMDSLKRFRGNDDITIHYVVLGILEGMGIVQPLAHGVEAKYMRKGELSKYASVPHLFCINDRIDDNDKVVLEKIIFGRKNG
jgi:hypothetical protein